MWSVGAQAQITNLVQSVPKARGLASDRILVTPTPFNTLLWRVDPLHDDRYQEAFYSLTDSLADPDHNIRFVSFPRGDDLDQHTADFEDANLIRSFSNGFCALSDDGRRIRISDLRMGQHPLYTFTSAFAEYQSKPALPIEPLGYPELLPFGPGIAWIWNRIRDEDLPVYPAL